MKCGQAYITLIVGGLYQINNNNNNNRHLFRGDTDMRMKQVNSVNNKLQSKVLQKNKGNNKLKYLK